MVTIIAIIYIFLSYRYFVNSWELLWKNPQNHPPPPLLPHGKTHSPIFTQSPLKIQKVRVLPFCQHWKFFRSPCRKGTKFHTSVLHKIPIDLLYLWHQSIRKKYRQKYSLFMPNKCLYIIHHFKDKKRHQRKCFPVEFMKLSRTVAVASENMYITYYVIKNYEYIN